MRCRLAAVFALAGLIVPVGGLAGSASAQSWGDEMFQTTTHDFGTVARGAKAEYEFVMTNIFQGDVHIADVHASCGCTTPRIEKPLLKTYEKGGIIASINSGTFQGQRGATLTVTIDQPAWTVVQLHVTAFIRSDVMCEPASANFGTVEEGQPAEAQLTVTNYSYNAPQWQIVSVKSDNTHITAEALPGNRFGNQVSYQLRVHLDGKSSAGLLNDHLVLVSNDPQMPELPVTVEGQVLPTVAVTPASLFLGVVRPGEKVTKQIVVRSKQPFHVTGIDADQKSIQFSLPAAGAAKPLQLVPITFVAGAELGKVVKAIRISTDVDSTPVEVSAYAVVTQ
jgi:hypothetical protein